jgi:trans-aconitate 2-methyltransferase
MTEWDAPEYAKPSGLQQATAEEVLSLLDLKDTERLLDVGCGNGKVTAEIAARVPQGAVVGLDSSADMITFASRHFGRTIRPNLRFGVTGARRLSFKEEFDLVISFNVLHGIPEEEQQLRIHTRGREARWHGTTAAGPRRQA